jgi:predicted GNAT family N-acyltransferase
MPSKIYLGTSNADADFSFLGRGFGFVYRALRSAFQRLAVKLTGASLRTDTWFGNDPRYAPQMQAVLGLRYQIYVSELGKPLPTADHQRKQLPVTNDESAWHLLVSTRQGVAVGCVRFHLGDQLSDTLLTPMRLQGMPAQERQRTGYVSKLMVTRSMRGRGAALMLMHAMAALARQQTKGQGDCALFHCNPKLVPGYQRVGFRVIGPPFVDQHVGQQVPMVYLLDDLEHLRAIRSPLASIAQQLEPSADRIRELHARYRLNSAATSANETRFPSHGLEQ